MTGFTTKATTALALGLPNIIRAASYRLGVKSRLSAVLRLQGAVAQGPFFQAALGGAPVASRAVRNWQTSAKLFSHWPFAVTAQPPDWSANPFNGQCVASPDRGWWQIPDFDPAVGDIKQVWELSRMDWVLAFAQRARQGDAEALARLNSWLAGWCERNPPYRGPNWKCGQEASVRVMHLSMAALMLGQVRRPPPGLRDLVRLHLQRIAATVRYAMAQDNNHGTSEAAALFIGGSWLAALGMAEGARWEGIGRRWLEDRAARLIGSQGSFSQYSLNYHRVMLDTLCMAEVWRQYMALPGFSERWQERALAAAQWLRHMISAVTGDGPNVGANDGARLLQLSDTAYRDYRPSVQLGMVLFAGQRAFADEGPWNLPLHWLGIALPDAVAPPTRSLVADDGGFAMLWHGEAMALLRYPRFRFRPSQADALHVDLWLRGANLLRDAGTFSYNTEQEWLDYFSGTASHNTVQFDGRDQMPRLSRFLFGDWLETNRLEPFSEDLGSVGFAAGYSDRYGARHHRRIRLSESVLAVEDAVGGFTRKAVLRWRLRPGAWRLDGTRIEHDGHVLTVQASVPIVRCELVEGWESRHYLEKTATPVLEVEVQRPGTFTTEYRWAT